MMTNKMLLDFMKGFKEEINAGNVALSEKIEKKIENIDLKIDKNIEKINNKIMNIDDAIDKLRINTDENKVEARGMNERMSRRMDELEKEMNRSEEINRRTKELRNLERNLAVQPAGRNKTSENLNYSSDWAKRLEEELYKDANRER